MNPVHKTLRPLLNLSGLTGFRIAFLSEDTPNRNYLYLWISSRHLKQFLYQFIKHCDIAIQAISQSSCDAYFIFEHKSHYSLVLYVALIATGKPVFFLVHGLQQLYRRSALHFAGFKVLQYLVSHFAFYPVHIEKSDWLLPRSERFQLSKCLTIPLVHPVNESNDDTFGQKWHQARLRVGIVGMFRQDKPTQKLIELLVEIQHINNSFDLIVGTPFWQKPRFLDVMNIEVVDTSDETSYNKLLASLHVSVQDFNKKDYYFRPSGTINDAVVHECFVICPSYPVFEEQITVPVVVGASFSNHEDLISLIPFVMENLKSCKPDFHTWKKYRKMVTIAPIIKSFISSKIR